jgi:hypothetical protein
VNCDHSKMVDALCAKDRLPLGVVVASLGAHHAGSLGRSRCIGIVDEGAVGGLAEGEARATELSTRSLSLGHSGGSRGGRGIGTGAWVDATVAELPAAVEIAALE